MNNLKKFTSTLDRQKVNIYKNFLRRGTKGEEETTTEAANYEKTSNKTQTKKPVEASRDNNTVIVESTDSSGAASQTTVSEKRKERAYHTSGPYLFVSKLLNKKGPLTSKQIYREYLKDEEAKNENIINSLAHLKQKVLKPMRENKKIESAGFDFQRRIHKGYRVNPEKAFDHTHPDILVRLEPRPLIKRFNKPDVLEALRKMEKENPLM